MKKKTGFWAEFKEFISRGNVIDLAVGVIIGTAFTAIVNSLVKDMVMPLIGWMLSGTDFTQYKYVISPAVGDVAESAILYGNFIQNVFNFLLIAFVVFLFVKGINRFRRKKEEEALAEPAKPSEELAMLTEIRDLLKQQAAGEKDSK